jgi:hypothetical protein
MEGFVRDERPEPDVRRLPVAATKQPTPQLCLRSLGYALFDSAAAKHGGAVSSARGERDATKTG